MNVRLFVAALLAVLTFASSAWADSAWVRWLNDPAGTDSWFREDAFDTRRACVKTLDESQKHYGKDRVVQRASDTVLIVHRQKAEAMRLDCLPDTIDPRGSKGK